MASHSSSTEPLDCVRPGTRASCRDLCTWGSRASGPPRPAAWPDGQMKLPKEGKSWEPLASLSLGRFHCFALVVFHGQRVLRGQRVTWDFARSGRLKRLVKQRSMRAISTTSVDRLRAALYLGATGSWCSSRWAGKSTTTMATCNSSTSCEQKCLRGIKSVTPASLPTQPFIAPPRTHTIQTHTNNSRARPNSSTVANSSCRSLTGNILPACKTIRGTWVHSSRGSQVLTAERPTGGGLDDLPGSQQRHGLLAPLGCAELRFALSCSSVQSRGANKVLFPNYLALFRNYSSETISRSSEAYLHALESILQNLYNIVT